MPMKKILFCATVDFHFEKFHLPVMKWFKEQGWSVHVAAHGNLELPYTDKKFNLPIQRSPISKLNLLAYRELKALIDENQYQIIDCHTPMGGVLARLAAKSQRTKVIYTAHGFHFYKGAPRLNWLLYYPIEKLLAKNTDSLITINKEDYQTATSNRFRAAAIHHVHGVGVDTTRFRPIPDAVKQELRKKLGYVENEFLLFYAAEFNKNKNQQLLINILADLTKELPQVKLLLAGEGPLLEECRKLAKDKKVEDKVEFLGYQKDILPFLNVSDLAVASSLREGLPVNILEAMACGLPVLANKNRGHHDLIQNNKTGWMVETQHAAEYVRKIRLLASNPELRKRLGANGRSVVLEKFSITKVLAEKTAICKEYMNELEEEKWEIH
ncbi:glycosyltransferase family 4 protein [Fictibacillus fluitans]|uniref:Glycosyltransferase family 4 protein n=1 Tax=Fictibacillus fluitans TaxID=3058422 RepID=A0ABT8I137_9BACL|nr:glycosyltransferase family 4 protein [Fictibacillus sp. NE201]MDN4526735.1 glycosyltransferase family 4 protein [Fictibacillus sp. NE201]